MAKKAAATGSDAEAAQIRWGGSHCFIVVRVGTSGSTPGTSLSLSKSSHLYRDHSHLLCTSQISHPEPAIPKESFVVHIPKCASRSCAYEDESDDDEERFACFVSFCFLTRPT